MATLGDDDETYLLKEDPFDFETLLNPGPEGEAVDGDAIFQADVFLEMEKRYLKVNLVASGDYAHLLVVDPFPGRLAAAFAEAGGVAAVFESFGEWRWLREPHDQIPVSDELDRHEVGLDAFVAFLLKQPRARP